MGQPNKTKEFQSSDVEKAIKGSKGFMSSIAKILGVDWHTAKKLVDMHNLEQLVQNEKETMKDFVESKLYQNINENDTTSIIFYLKTQAKDRGYVEKTEQSVTHDGQVNIISIGGKEFEI